MAMKSPEEMKMMKRVSSKLHALHYDVPYAFDSLEFFERVVDDFVQASRRTREMKESFEKELNIQIEKAIRSESKCMDLESENESLRNRTLEQEEEIRRGMEEWSVEIHALDEQRETLQKKLVSVEESHNKEIQKNLAMEQDLLSTKKEMEALQKDSCNLAAAEKRADELQNQLRVAQNSHQEAMCTIQQKENELLNLKQQLEEAKVNQQKARLAEYSRENIVKSLTAQVDFMAERIAAYEENEPQAKEMEMQTKKLERQLNKLTAERNDLLRALESDAKCKNRKKKAAAHDKNQQALTDSKIELQHSQAIKNMQQEIQELQLALELSNKNECKLREALVNSQAEVSDMKMQLASVSARSREAETMAVTELNNEIAHAEELCATLERRLVQNNNAHEKEKAALERRAMEMKDILDCNNVEIAELKSLISSLDDTCNTLSCRLKSLAQEKLELQRKVSASEGERLRDRQLIEDASLEKERHNLIIEDYERKNRELHSKIAHTEQKTNDAQAEVTKLLRASEQAKASADIADMKYEQVMDVLKNKDTELANKSKEVVDLTEKLHAISEECKKRERESQLARAEADDAMMEANVLGTKLHSLRQRLSSTEQARDELQDRLNAANKALNKKEAEIMDLLVSYRELGKDAAQLESELFSLRGQVQHPSLKRSSTNELQKTDIEPTCEGSSLDRHIASLTKKLIAAEKERGKLRGMLEEATITRGRDTNTTHETSTISKNTQNPIHIEDRPERKVLLNSKDDPDGSTSPPRTPPASPTSVQTKHQDRYNSDSPSCSPQDTVHFSALRRELRREREYYETKHQYDKDKHDAMETDFKELLEKVSRYGFSESHS